MKTDLEEIAPRSTATAGKHLNMIKIKKILVPLDFSRGSMEAYDYAVSLAKKFNAQVEVAHVQLPDEACSVPGAGHLMRECAEAATFVQQRLGQLKPERPAHFWPENCHIRTGQPYQQICRLASEQNIDLIVLGSRGNTGLKRVFLGSTAERVVRFAPCPVLVVRRWKRGDFRIRKILVPSDFSQCAMAGQMYGALWAKRFDAKLRLLYVLFPPAPVLIDRIATNLPTEQTGIPTETKLEMEALTKLDFMEGVKSERKIKIGYATDVICAETDDVDLVVISTHGRSGFQHALMGSVAEQVVRYADCPVLVVPSSHALSW